MASSGTGGDPRAEEIVSLPLDAVPVTGATAAADGRVLLARVDGEVVAYRNACLHRGSRLDEGAVRAGIVTCPAHLWRYRLADGACLNSPGSLTRLRCEVEGDEVRVRLPAAATEPLREVLRAHARSWRRGP